MEISGTGAGAVQPGAGQNTSVPHQRGLNQSWSEQRYPGQADKVPTGGGFCSVELARQLGAMEVSPGLLQHQSEYPYPVMAGEGAGGRCIVETAAELACLPAASVTRLVVLDTETTGLAGGTGTLPFLTGIVTCDGAGVTLKQWLVTRFEGEAAMLYALADVMQPGDLLLTYNGKTFDVPLLQTRARLERVAIDLERLPHLDLLHLVRKAFARRWPDCKLQTAERRLLHLHRDEDITAADIPSVWFDWMRFGYYHGLISVVRHNRLDLINLAALVERMAHVFAQPGLYGARITATGRHHALSEAQLLERLLDASDCLDAAERLELARLARRAGQWDVAIKTWHQLAAANHPQAIEHLAKFHEHRQRDIKAALVETTRLIELEGRKPAHQHRESRLRAKLTRMDARLLDESA